MRSAQSGWSIKPRPKAKSPPVFYRSEGVLSGLTSKILERGASDTLLKM
jgi:hypothetical protein